MDMALNILKGEKRGEGMRKREKKKKGEGKGDFLGGEKERRENLIAGEAVKTSVVITSSMETSEGLRSLAAI